MDPSAIDIHEKMHQKVTALISLMLSIGTYNFPKLLHNLRQSQPRILLHQPTVALRPNLPLNMVVHHSQVRLDNRLVSEAAVPIEFSTEFGAALDDKQDRIGIAAHADFLDGVEV